MELLNAMISSGYSKNEATEIINELTERVMEGENPEELLYEIGFEPDYIFDIIP